MKRLAALAAWLYLAVGVAHAQPAREFITSYWYGPPPDRTSLETYQQIKDANFNVVFPPCAIDPSLTCEQNNAVLDICQKLGMKAVVYDPRMPQAMDGDAKARIDAIVADYSKHPALLAYFIVDEPSAGQFEKLGGVMKYLKERDPDHPGYINLFPMHANKETQLGTATYEEYVDRFVKAVDPFVISYDHYPFIKGFDQPEFIPNLATIRNAGLASKRPFWNIVQCTQHYSYRRLTEPEFRYMAMQTLAFGGRGLLWYTYWYPGPEIPEVSHAMTKFDGTPDEPYAWIKQINADARAIGTELLDAESWATFQVGPGAEYAMPAGSPITADGGRVSIGVFKRPDGSSMALVTNRDYAKETSAKLEVEPTSATVEQFDARTGKWSTATRPLTLKIPAGDGILLRW